VGAVVHSGNGDRSCHGVPRRVVRLARAVVMPTVGSAREYMRWAFIYQSPAVISAHRNPANSRAMATVTTLRLVLRALRSDA